MELVPSTNDTNRDLERFLSQVKDELKKSFSGRANHGLADMAEYHFETYGKLLRPHIIYQLGTLLGCKEQDLLSWSSCCELLHNATLVHDDIQDEDEVRRGRATVWKKFGKKQAINLGDFLIFVSPTPIYSSQLDSVKKLELLQVLLEMSSRLVDGQNLEFELPDVHCPKELKLKYKLCIKNKTAALFGGMAEGTAILGDLFESEKLQLKELFETVGLLFQMQDDLLDLYGDKQRGESGCDIKEGKISCLLVHLYYCDPQKYNQTLGVLKKSRCETSECEIGVIKELLETSGALDSCIGELLGLVKDVRANLLFQQNSRLQEFCESILSKILQPIAHLILDRGRR